jgi:hypothetical protein
VREIVLLGVLLVTGVRKKEKSAQPKSACMWPAQNEQVTHKKLPRIFDTIMLDVITYSEFLIAGVHFK